MPLLVLIATLKTTQSIYGTFDVWFDDETTYLEAAVRKVPPGYLPLADSSPLYPAWYRLLHLFQPDPLKLYFLDWYVLNLALPLLLYALARRSGASLGAAAAVAIAWSYSGAVVTWPFVSKFATLVLGASALAGTYVRDKRLAAAVTVFGMALAAYARAELATPSMLFGGVVALWSIGRLGASVRAPAHRRRLIARLKLLLAVALAGGAPVLLRKIFGDVGTGGRSYFAFQQHYGLNVIEARGLRIDPWTNWEPYVREAFPKATSIVEALRENPSAFAWHVKRNLWNEPIVIFTKLLHPLPHIPIPVVKITGYVLAFVFALGVVALSLRPHALDRRLTAWLPLLGAVAVTTAGATLLIYPREHYLVPFVWLSLAALAGASGSLTLPYWLRLRYWLRLPRLSARRQLVNVPVVVAITAMVALFPARTSAYPSILKPVGPPPDDPLEGVRTIQLLRTLKLHGPVVILESDHSRGVYANIADFHRVPQWDKNGPFWAFVHATWVNTIIINNRLRWDTRFANDPSFTAFVEQRGPLENFVFFPVKGTSVVVAIHRDVLTGNR